MPDEKKWTFEEVEALYRQFNPNAVDGTGKKVLVADDSSPMRSLLASALEKKGFIPLVAENGLEALKVIRNKQPDCCLLDITMPQVSGLDVLEAMKKDPRYESIPVLIVTGRKEKRDIVLATRLGAAGYIVKPFEMQDLLQRVSSLLEEPDADNEEPL